MTTPAASNQGGRGGDQGNAAREEASGLTEANGLRKLGAAQTNNALGLQHARSSADPQPQRSHRTAQNQSSPDGK